MPCASCTQILAVIRNHKEIISAFNQDYYSASDSDKAMMKREIASKEQEIRNLESRMQMCNCG